MASMQCRNCDQMGHSVRIFRSLLTYKTLLLTSNSLASAPSQRIGPRLNAETVVKRATARVVARTPQSRMTPLLVVMTPLMLVLQVVVGRTLPVVVLL